MDETTSAPIPAPAPVPAPRKRSRAWVWILGGAFAVVLVAAAVVLLFFRLPAYRLLVGDHKYVVAVEKENVKVALRTAGTSYAAAVKAAQKVVGVQADSGPDAFRVQGSLAFGLDDGLLEGIGLANGPDSATLAEAIRNLHLDFVADTAPQGGSSRTDLTLGYGSADLLRAGFVALSDGRFLIDAPDLFSYLLVFTPAELTGAAGQTQRPTGTASLPASQLEAILTKLDVDGPALSKALAAYADLYATALDQGDIAATEATTVEVGDITVPCTTMRVRLTGEQFATMLQGVLAHASTDRVLYDQTIGALRTAMQAVVDGATTSGTDEVAALRQSLDEMPTYDEWTAALTKAADGVSAESLNLAVFTQSLSIGAEGRVVSRTLSFVPAKSQAGGTQTLTFAQAPVKSGTVTHVAYRIENALVFDSLSRTTLGKQSGTSGTLTVDLGAAGFLAGADLGSGIVTLDYTGSTDLAAHTTDLELNLSAESDWLEPAVTLTMTVHDEGAAVDSGTTTLVLEYDSPQGKASMDLTMTRRTAEPLEIVWPTAENSIDLGNLSEDDSLALQMELQTNLPAVLDRVQQAAPDFYDWFLTNFATR